MPPFPTQRSRELFANLATQPNQPHARASLAGNLWPEKPEEKARASLNTELWRVRQVLGKADEFLELTRDTVALNLPFEQVDIHQFRALVQRGDAAALQQAMTLYRGEFLDGCYADWCLLEREHLSDLFRAALNGLLRHHEARGDLAEAISVAKRLSALDPLREDMHRALMRLYAALGDRPAALAQYQTCKAVIQRELGIAPMPETEALYARIRTTALLQDHWLTRQEAARTVSAHRLAEMRAAKQYLAELYTARLALEGRVDEFLRSDAVGLLLVGDSGCGKTTFLAHLAEMRLAQGDLALLLDASALTLNFQRELTRWLWGSESVSTEEALAALGREAAAQGRLVWVILDELSAFHDLGAGPADLLRRLDALVVSIHRQPDLRSVKFVLSCRRHAWDQLTLGGVNPNWQCYFERAPLAVTPFSTEEKRAAFETYRRYFRIQNSFDDLPDAMCERFHSPFFLRLAAETWQGNAIPASESGGRLFRAYFEHVVANPSARQFVADLVTHIARRKQAELTLSELRADPVFQFALSDDSHSPFQQLLGAGVLTVGGNEFAPRLRFAHEGLLEYLLAQYYEAQCAEGKAGKDCIIEIARGSWDFPALWGAALMLLQLGKNVDSLILLAESGFSEARQLAVETLVALQVDDPASAVLFARRLLDQPSVEAKRVALFAASRMGEAGLDLFRSAAGSRDAFTRQTAFVVVNAVYQNDPQTVLAILHRLLDDIGLKALVTSSARLQTALRVLGLFTRYGLSKNLTDEADDLIHTVTVKKLRLPTEKGQMGRTLIKRLLSVNTTSWPADRNAVETVARPGSLSSAEEGAFRRVLAALKLREAGLERVEVDDLQTLLASPADAVRYLAHHQLCLWLNLRQAEALSVIQTLFDSASDPEVQLWLLMTFQPLNAPWLQPFDVESLLSLENLTALFAEEQRDLFLKGGSRGTLGLFGPIGFFPLGMRYARARKFDFPLLSAYLNEDPGTVAQTLRLLAPVGWFHPQEALAFFEKAVDFKTELHPEVIVSLGLLWVSHVGVVDHFLRRMGMDAVTQRQVHAAADIEKTLRAINLIHNTDLRVSSILLGAPYGRWVTDSVFAGYVDSNSFEEAASRFGKGLTEVFMESGWRLKRVLGLEER